MNLKHFLSKQSATSFSPLLNDKIPKTLMQSQRGLRLLGFDERISLALAGIQRLSCLCCYLSGFALFFSPQLQLSNIEEVLVYFCLLLESELAAGSDSRADQAGMCSSHSDQTTVRK